MGETIAKTGVKRDKGLIYYIKGGDVWGSPLKKPGTPKGKAAKIASTGVELDYSKFMYYVGTDNNNELVVERTDRQVGGSKRKKSSKAAAPKKASKPAAKKAPAKKAAKKAPAKKGGGKKGKRK
jgi:topoisomerase IA-like protein